MSLTDHLSLRLLQLLSAVHETGSLTQASARLHVVPSAASRRIRACELALGMQLIERSPRGVVLTPAGKVMVRYAGRVQRDLQELAVELSDLAQGVRGRVTLSAAASAIAQHLPEDLGRFLRRHPDIRVDIQEHFSRDIVDRLRQRQTDVGILVALEAQIAGLRLRPYRQETLTVVVPTGHRLCGQKGLRFEALLEETWVGLPAGTSLALQLRAKAAEYGVELRTRIAVYGMDSMCRMVQNGLGIAILPTTALGPNGYPGLATIDLQEPWAQRTLYVAVHAEVELEPAAQALFVALSREDAPPALSTAAT